MPSAPVIALAVLGPVAVAVAWLIVRRGVSIWVAMGATLAVLGVLSLATGRVQVSPTVELPLALASGVGTGLSLYAATAGFMAVARRWPPLARQAAALYDQRRDVPLARALAISILLTVPGEELLWRGIVQGSLGEAYTAPVAAALAWAAYVAANAVSGSVPIVLGVLVGGAVWTALALWTGGVVASLVCHAVWTGLMIVAPPIGAAPA